MPDLAGSLESLVIEAEEGRDAQYRLSFFEGDELPLNRHIGGGIEIRYEGVVRCRYCGTQSRRSFGGGYCFTCFRTLARCDLCVVSPDRCHYDAGTCREPAWGEAFCMQPHRVYLANSSGIKVGITRRGAERGRWLDQGAIQGLVIAEADSRRAAGLAEVTIARRLPDRTDWRKMLRADVPELDLAGAAAGIREEVSLPAGVRWATAQQIVRLSYPIESRASPVQTLKLTDATVSGNLLGMKGQYLLLTGGAFNVRQHAGYRVTVRLGAPRAADGGQGDQLGLF